MLEINKLSIGFKSYDTGLRLKSRCTIRSLDLRVEAGQLVAVVGESGAGKSLLAHALLGILPANASISGDMIFKGRRLSKKQVECLRGREIALIPQSINYLNPLIQVGPQIARAGLLSGLSPSSARNASSMSLRRYDLSDRVSRQYPFQLSGGMARRVLTATATVGSADLLLADEPTNGLDPDNAMTTLTHLRELADSGKAVVLITHDIAAALKVADTVSVFYKGVTVEEARAKDFTSIEKLRHPYTQALWAALPRNLFTHDLVSANSVDVSFGCPHYCRCRQQDEHCCQQLPPLKEQHGGKVRCWHA